MINKTIKFILILLSTNIMVIYYNHNFSYCYAFETATINELKTINLEIANAPPYDFIIFNHIIIEKNGYVNGNITPVSNNVGTVTIKNNYNTVRDTGSGIYATNFGTSTAHIENVNLVGKNQNERNEFWISNAFYAKNLNISNADLTINYATNINIDHITKSSNDSVVNIKINYDFGSDVKFGTSTSHIDNININEAILTINKDAYVDIINLDTKNATLNLNNGGKIFGTIIGGNGGNGTININSSYDGGTDTIFGKAANSIGNLNVNSGTLVLNNVAYIDLINVKDSSILNLATNSGINGIVSGEGILNIDRNYTATNNPANLTSSFNTKFGTEQDILSNLNINNSYSLTLNNSIAFIDNLTLSGKTSVLNIQSNAGINGIIKGTANNDGTVNLTRDYDTINTTSTNYFETTFGIDGNAIGRLNVGGTTANALTLGNVAYINNLVVNNTSSIINLEGEAGIIGSIIGSGTLNILKDYTLNSTTDLNNNTYDTKLGIDKTNRLNTINIGKNSYFTIPEIVSNIVLQNTAYINTMNISNNSILNIEGTGFIYGTIQGSSDKQGVVNINRAYDTSISDTIFGTTNNKLKEVNIINNIANNTFTLGNSAYIDNLQINADNLTYAESTNLLRMTSGSIFNGSITLNKSDNDTLLGITLDKNDSISLSNLLSLINNTESGSSNVASGNEIFLNLIDKTKLVEGTIIDLLNYNLDYSNAALTYDSIFLNLELDKTTANVLKLKINANRTPTLKDVSEATIIASNVIDDWVFFKKTSDENTLTFNLQNISNNKDFFHALTNLTPDVSGLNIKIPIQSIISTIQNIDKRLNFLRTAKIADSSNIFSEMLENNMLPYYDEYIKRRNIWWEVFGGNMHQDDVENIFGYDVNYYGTTIGYDLFKSPSFVFGTSYTFNTVKANNLDFIKTDRDIMETITNNINLYLMLYNKINYFTINVGAGYNIYEQKRNINFYNFNKIADSSYNGFSYNADIEYGINIFLYKNTIKNKKIKRKDLEINNIEEISNKLDLYTNGIPNLSFIALTPKLSLSYNKIMIEDYTEKGAEAANLVIKTNDFQSLDANGGLSLTFHKALKNNITSFQTILSGFISYPLLNNKIEIEAKYIDDDQTFIVFGIDNSALKYNFGIGMFLNFYNKIDLGISYNYTMGDNFNGMIGKISVLYNF